VVEKRDGRFDFGSIFAGPWVPDSIL